MRQKNVFSAIIIPVAAFLFCLGANAAEEANIKLLFGDKIEKTEGIALCPDGRMFAAENESGKVYELVGDENIRLFSEGYLRPAGMACD